jgi:putative hemolysin
MARGFESKSVADQQADAENRAARRPDAVPPDAATALRRRRLELARADARHRLEQATDQRYRAMLEKAVADLDKQIGEIG